jgi:hypothetical protein
MSEAHGHKIRKFIKTSARSLVPLDDAFLRTMIGIVIIILTFLMTLRAPKVPVEWESIFLLVIGYYFKARPSEDKGTRDLLPEQKPAEDAAKRIRGEMTYQFLLAFVLIAGAALSFFLCGPKPEISGAWIGGVMLAVAFYFKPGPVEAIEDARRTFRGILAMEALLGTVPIVLVFMAKLKDGPPIPTQWAVMLAVVAGFYFKESATS